MDLERRVRLVRTLAVTVVVMTFALMVLGSWVKATGSGLACPDWPKCYGEWLPPFPSAEAGSIHDGEPVVYSHDQVLYEWGHRLLASVLGVPFAALALLAATGRGLHPNLRWLPAFAGSVLVIQVLLGGITVLGKNAAPLTTAHLATATVFFFLVTMAMAQAYLRPTMEGAAAPETAGRAAAPRDEESAPEGEPTATPDGPTAPMGLAALWQRLRGAFRPQEPEPEPEPVRFPGEDAEARRD